MRRVYTIGYDSRLFNSFLRVLRYYGIGIVVDVRRFPKSRIECYNKESLEGRLPENNIEYVWLGDNLGGLGRDYIEFMKTDSYWNGIKRLINIVEDEFKRNVYSVVMCKELIPWRCHRRFIAATLHSLGYKVIHIVNRGNTIEQRHGLEKYGLDTLLSDKRFYHRL